MRGQGLACLGVQVDLKERAELWKKALAGLDALTSEHEKFGDVEELINKISRDLAESNWESQDPSSTLEQQSIAIKLQSTLENLRREAEELKQVEAKLKGIYNRMETELQIRERIKEQLRKKLESYIHSK